MEKISGLHGRVQKMLQFVDELPAIISRFESLKELHEESSSFVMDIVNLSNIHNKISI